MSRKKRQKPLWVSLILIWLWLIGLLTLCWAMPTPIQLICLAIFIPLICLIWILRRRYIRAEKANRLAKQRLSRTSSTTGSKLIDFARSPDPRLPKAPKANPRDFNRPLDPRKLPKDPLEPVAISPILDKLLKKHASEIQKRAVQLTFDNYPSNIMGRPKTVKLIFEHILSYALQMAGEDSPEINISGFRNEGYATYEISYNGAIHDIEAQRRSLTSFMLDPRQERFRYEMHLPTAQRLLKELEGEMGLEAVAEGGGKVWFKLRLPPSAR